MDLIVQSQMQAQQRQILFKGLYDTVKPVVWVVRIPGKIEINEPKWLTAFAVDKPGHLLTTAHGWRHWEHKTVQVRCLSGTSGFETAFVLACKPSWDVCLLSLVVSPPDESKFAVGQLGAGELKVGDVVMAVGHPFDAIGSGLIGHVVYPFIPQTDYNLDDGTTCREFEYKGVDTPSHRIMGHICNKQFYEEGELTFVRDLQARLPIVHSAGLVAGLVACVSGAPIFNLKGEIIGMYTFGLDNLDVGIHVSVLAKFLAEYQTDL